jgi:hypothetical protein
MLYIQTLACLMTLEAFKSMSKHSILSVSNERKATQKNENNKNFFLTLHDYQSSIFINVNIKKSI